MSKRRKKKYVPRGFNEMAKTVRGSWGDVNPVMRVERDKTKYTRKKKHKNNDSYLYALVEG